MFIPYSCGRLHIANARKSITLDQRSKMKSHKVESKVVSYSNFNPVAVSECAVLAAVAREPCMQRRSLLQESANINVYIVRACSSTSINCNLLCIHTPTTYTQLFSLILLSIGVILGAVSIGIGQWSRLETDRKDGGVNDGATVKTLGLLSRCVSYTLTTEVLSLGLSLDEQPQVHYM